ncbi:acylthioesterase ii [Phlyctema vagabunda]|uniref:Acylthioesterase ii n=1 Tax=Phlyctema vagabunda TaxID=108571 RepID=A0ABR4PZ92_9HELO
MSTQPSTLAEQVSVQQVSDDEFVSTYNPEKMGNNANIAYGGCTIATAVSAAYQTVTAAYHLYTAMGNYLGPASLDRPIYAKVTRIRDTRTFATRQIQLSQKQNDGSMRPCAIVLADFQTQEPGTLSGMEYSAPPSKKYTRVEDCLSPTDSIAKMLKEGKISQQLVQQSKIAFGLNARYLDTAIVPESTMGQNVTGIAKETITTQDHLPLVEKTSADWSRCKSVLESEYEHVAGVAFVMDGGLAFMPLAHSHLFFEDAGACSTLDFSLRFFSNRIDYNVWHLREMKTIRGGEGRTYSEARLWNEAGELVASMTQQNILRPPPPPKAAL